MMCERMKVERASAIAATIVMVLIIFLAGNPSYHEQTCACLQRRACYVFLHRLSNLTGDKIVRELCTGNL